MLDRTRRHSIVFGLLLFRLQEVVFQLQQFAVVQIVLIFVQLEFDFVQEHGGFRLGEQLVAGKRTALVRRLSSAYVLSAKRADLGSFEGYRR